MKWISVKDRLPEVTCYLKELFLVSDGIGISTGKLDHTDEENDIFRCDGGLEYPMFSSDITHWMPLPKPPEEKK